MELQTLRNFIEIADHGSITAAARTLGNFTTRTIAPIKDLKRARR
ncbi:fhu operon transcription regulator [Lacticaseibacillus paracasei subsp. paracasei Lpp7]|uniref:Fhu operon transcription regulator n=1 Tax=Lacticaseibacillus paracasei subsp. paracasei Lpp7 TaxID=1256200 RepID=A0A8E0IFR2_LACPA|nr:fhu operon transcription regulator [Lacticaseibacillus paracasei subsp. paracasei Lpp7]